MGQSYLDNIHDKKVWEIWNEKAGLMENNKKEYDFEKGLFELPESFFVADLSEQKIGSGFPWGKSGPKPKIIRPNDEAIWIVEQRLKQGLLARLFRGNR